MKGWWIPCLHRSACPLPIVPFRLEHCCRGHRKNDSWMPTAAPVPGEDLAPRAAAGSLCSLPLAQRASRSGSGLGKPAGGLHALGALGPAGDCASCGGHPRQLCSGGTFLQSRHPHGFNRFQWRNCPGEKCHSLGLVFSYVHAGVKLRREGCCEAALRFCRAMGEGF